MVKPKRLPTIAELAQHVRDLAAAFHVELVEEDTLAPERGISYHLSLGKLQAKLVRIRTVTSEDTYAIALHELGHCCAPSGLLRTAGNRENDLLKLEEERCAWEWAQYHALDWTVTMEMVMQLAMKEYTKQHQEMKNAIHRAEREDEARTAGLGKWMKKVGLK